MKGMVKALAPLAQPIVSLRVAVNPTPHLAQSIATTIVVAVVDGSNLTKAWEECNNNSLIKVMNKLNLN